MHCLQRGHAGVNKMDQQVKLRYYRITREIVRGFTKVCPQCNLKQVQHSQPRLNPIRSDDFLSRFQIDLVDMRNHKVETNFSSIIS